MDSKVWARTLVVSKGVLMIDCFYHVHLGHPHDEQFEGGYYLRHWQLYEYRHGARIHCHSIPESKSLSSSLRKKSCFHSLWTRDDASMKLMMAVKSPKQRKP